MLDLSELIKQKRYSHDQSNFIVTKILPSDSSDIVEFKIMSVVLFVEVINNFYGRQMTLNPLLPRHKIKKRLSLYRLSHFFITSKFMMDPIKATFLIHHALYKSFDLEILASFLPFLYPKEFEVSDHLGNE